MESCCVCLGNILLPVILNSGTSVCHDCVDKISYCPTIHIIVSIKLLNTFAMKFFQYPPVFSISDLLESPDKIAYMNKFDEINLGDPTDLIEDGEFLLNMDEFKIFASKCINLNGTDRYRRQLIHWLCSINNLDMVKFLVANGADVNCIDGLMCSPIHCVHFGVDGALELIKYLVKHGADVNCRALFGRSLIHYVCMQSVGSLELVEYLVEEIGVDVNCIDSNGWRPIHFACWGSVSVEIIEYLIANGADPNVRTYNGKLPSDLTGNVKILQLLGKN